MPACWRHVEVLAQGSGCGCLSDSSAPGQAPGLHWCTRVSCGQSELPWNSWFGHGGEHEQTGIYRAKQSCMDAIAVPWVPGQRAKRTRVAISYSQLIAPPSVEEASSPERNRKLWNVLICPKSQNSNQKFYLNFWPSFFTFLLPFAGSPDPTQILPCLLCPNSTKHTVTTEDQAHTACSFPTLHKHSPTMKPAGFFPITVTDGISQVLGRQSQHSIATPCLEDINPQQAPGSEFTTVSP